MEHDKDKKSARDWAGTIGESVESMSAALLERVTRPILVAVRAFVLASIVAALAIFTIVVAVIGLVRLFDTSVFPGQTWATDLFVAGIFLVAGTLLWSLSGRKKEGGAHD
ncbi:MAG TPA: hypothetical protein VKR27_05745 [Acidimicrobiales bacterium]|nr:hypothetical protein [Acidimicrobiales bacterium]